ncbi:MAG: NAD(P)H-dependent oxidoreductase [Pseudomonadota bacterium]
MAQNILRIETSARAEGSLSRELTDRLINRLSDAQTHIVTRDVGKTPPSIITEAWIQANFTPDETRSIEQREMLGESDTLISELETADTIVIGLPMYNFGVPAAFKAWIDQVARARRTFQYTANGPEGLLHGKRAIVVVTSGGTQTGSEIDFVTPYARHVLGFLGIKDVTVIAADQLMAHAEIRLAHAQAEIDALAA